jgi:hypothetical protein
MGRHNYITPVACPVCGAKPKVDRCFPGPGWSAGCFSYMVREHYIGANGDTRDEAVAKYNLAVAAHNLGLGEEAAGFGKQEI